mmetsp:Transcript_63733/g.156845  ORF Transcript_63733/g.156845 Transcript_63733/m.156845 type:complete len:208 (-) Transcript_63733:959-1582(-)
MDVLKSECVGGVPVTTHALHPASSPDVWWPSGRIWWGWPVTASSLSMAPSPLMSAWARCGGRGSWHSVRPVCRCSTSRPSMRCVTMTLALLGSGGARRPLLASRSASRLAFLSFLLRVPRAPARDDLPAPLRGSSGEKRPTSRAWCSSALRLSRSKSRGVLREKCDVYMRVSSLERHTWGSVWSVDPRYCRQSISPLCLCSVWSSSL